MPEKEIKVVTICGSTRFKKEIMDVAKELTLKGYIVMLPLVFGHSGDVISDDDKKKLDRLHLEKIDMSSEVHVVTIDNYIGESTRNEIKYSSSKGKTIIYHNQIKQESKDNLFSKAKEAEIYLFEKSNLSRDLKGMNLSDDLSKFIKYCESNLMEKSKPNNKPVLPSKPAERPKPTRPYVPDTKNCVIGRSSRIQAFAIILIDVLLLLSMILWLFN